MDFEPKVEVQVNTKNETKSHRFRVFLIFVSVILVGAALISAYFLFFSSFDKSSNKLTDFIEPLNNQLNNAEENNINLINNNKKYIASIYFQALNLKTTTVPAVFLGSGVFIGSEGYLATTKNIIQKLSPELSPDRYQLVTSNESLNINKIQNLYSDKNSNLVLLKFNDSRNPFLVLNTLRDSLNEGREVLSIYSQDENTEFKLQTSKGIISRFDLKTQNYSSDISQINEGGIVVDSGGNFVGIGDGVDSNNKLKIISNINIKTFYDEVVNSLTQNRKINLGIEFTFENLKNYMDGGKPVGNVVSVVEKDSVAYKSGLLVGDVILSINNEEFSSDLELKDFLSSDFVENELKFEIFRNKQKLNLILPLK